MNYRDVYVVFHDTTRRRMTIPDSLECATTSTSNFYICIFETNSDIQMEFGRSVMVPAS